VLLHALITHFSTNTSFKKPHDLHLSTNFSYPSRSRYQSSHAPFTSIDQPCRYSTTMKLNSIILLPFLPTAINAWTLVLGGQVFDGTGNRGCSRVTANAGSRLDWDRATFSDCCVRLYSDSGCGTQVGYSCSDWEKNLGQNVRGFKVTSC
jgi:hypothetical protein